MLVICQSLLILSLLLMESASTHAQIEEDEEEYPSVVVPTFRSSPMVVEVTVGETALVPCEVEGLGDYVLLWIAEKNRILFAGDLRITRDDRYQLNSGTLTITSVQPKDSGEYSCQLSTNPPMDLTHILNVQYPPKVQTSPRIIHAREGSNINLTCVIEAEPSPTVTWKKDGSQTIHSNEHHHLKVHGHSHMVLIHHVKKEDFGQYECSASNSLGGESARMFLTGVPQVPSFTSEPRSSQGTKYTISWTVNSRTPVDEYSLMYRKRSDEEEWEIKSIPAADITDEDMLIQMYQLTELQPATEYEAVVKARNKFGWSKQSEALVFTTKSEGISTQTTTTTTATEETSATPPISDSNARR